ncbi:MAG TPA: prepilin-type N-terminal cleavage/methylation domain-containing protein [Verrucomicrobiota bacterium]|nr:prepilin-type N-terminal cleavage/methylation domain-containing protein [Verrucomicrobiota bacterium]HNT14851.1 prepilin-type N-terminal cleavage/methylation domain-containing protein [Verrucomicrobiota bacterium]
MKTILPVTRDSQRPPARGGFTLIELLVVIAIIAILAAMLLPALAKAKQKAEQIYCLNNGKQLMLSVQLYTHDAEELFPPNEDDSGAPPGHCWVKGDAGAGGGEEFNPDILTDPATALLQPYVGNNITIYKCPADRRKPGIYRGRNPGMAGQRIPPVRSISMSQAVGTACNGKARNGGHTSGRITLPVSGPWLDGTHNHLSGRPFKTFGKMSHFTGAASPANIWVMMDEDPDSLNDGGFAVAITVPEWLDYPATFHNFGGGLSFADGHSEVHKWKDGKTKPRVPVSTISLPPANRVDWQWLADHTSTR